MRHLSWSIILTAVLIGCSGTNTGSPSPADGGTSGVKSGLCENCTKTADCDSGLRCLDLKCKQNENSCSGGNSQGDGDSSDTSDGSDTEATEGDTEVPDADTDTISETDQTETSDGDTDTAGETDGQVTDGDVTDQTETGGDTTTDGDSADTDPEIIPTVSLQGSCSVGMVCLALNQFRTRFGCLLPDRMAVLVGNPEYSVTTMATGCPDGFVQDAYFYYAIGSDGNGWYDGKKHCIQECTPSESLGCVPLTAMLASDKGYKCCREDGSTWEPAEYIVEEYEGYDCFKMVCGTDHQGRSAVVTAGYCSISMDGHTSECVPAGTVHNTCLICDPERETRAWSTLPGYCGERYDNTQFVCLTEGQLSGNGHMTCAPDSPAGWKADHGYCLSSESPTFAATPPISESVQPEGQADWECNICTCPDDPNEPCTWSGAAIPGTTICYDYNDRWKMRPGYCNADGGCDLWTNCNIAGDCNPP